MPYARIAITLPADLLGALDRRARQADRSRSRIIVDAIRAYLGAPAAVRVPAAPAYAGGDVARARRDQLERDLQRTPAERLRIAEGAARLARRARPRAPRQQIIGFESYEDFYEWKNSSRA